MTSRGNLRSLLPKRVAEFLTVSRRFGAIFRDCFVYPRAVYKSRAAQGGRVPKAEMNRHMKVWSDAVLGSLDIQLKTMGEAADEPMLLVGNHMSYVDIPLVLAATPCVFVAKKELSSWPFIGYTARSTDTVWVERGSTKSRADAGKAIAPAIKELGHKVVLFPSGTTTVDEKTPWKRGAFRIAQQHGLKVQPFRIRYTPVRRVAFIGNDLFVPHLWNLLAKGQITATLEWGTPQFITDVQKDCEAMQRWTMEGLANETTAG